MEIIVAMFPQTLHAKLENVQIFPQVGLILFAHHILVIVYSMVLVVPPQVYALFIQHLDLISKKKQHFVIPEHQQELESVLLLLELQNALLPSVNAISTK